MSAYYILTHTIVDADRYVPEYIQPAMEYLTKHGGEILAASFKVEALQGNPPDGVVVARFPSVEAVKAFVNDPGYQPLKKLRVELTKDASAVVVPEFVPR